MNPPRPSIKEGTLNESEVTPTNAHVRTILADSIYDEGELV